MKSVSQIESFADAIGQPRPQKRKSIAMKRRTAYGIFTVLGLTLMLVVSAGYVDWYGRVEANITVNDVIFVDGEAQTTISDSLDMWPCNTTNVTHTIQNIHDAYTYKLNLTQISTDEGLTATYYQLAGTQITDITIPPSTTVQFNISYHVACDADPDDSPYSAITEIKYLEAY